MGLFAWLCGEDSDDDSYGLVEKVRRIRISDIDFGHSPDKRGERTDKWGREPIAVRRRMFGGYVVVDGNDRLYYAAQRGDTHIEAEVWE